jgi:predicted O-linked N-acetylglucosamine transferase (SPINDLY family)
MLLRLMKDWFTRRLAADRTAIERARVALATGDVDTAHALCEELLRVAPRDTEVLHLAGAVASIRGDSERAIAMLTLAAESSSDPQPALGLAQLLRRAGRIAEAVEYFKRALEIDPGQYEARVALADTLYRNGDHAGAETHLREALAVRPDAVEAQELLTALLHHQARQAELASLGEHWQRSRPVGGRSIMLALLTPAILGSQREIEEVRSELARRLDELIDGPPLEVADPVREIRITPFYLAYHGMNDRDIQRRIGRLCRKAYRPACGAPIPPRREGGRIRVGFVSQHFNSHSVGRVTHGLVSGLPRDRFEVTVFSLARHDDELARLFRTRSDRYVALDGEPLAAIERAIAAERMDVLFFTDVGMDPLTYFLAYSRLAPLQCVFWGHPDTTGIDTLDCFISHDALEVEDAQEHYTERLVRLPAWVHPGYRRVARPSPLKSRGDYGLSANAHLYVCPQQPFKLHPDFDSAMAAILRGDPRAEIVLAEGQHPRFTQLLRQRFRSTLPDVEARIRILPHMPWADYLNLIAISDVMLDPFHFGGCNTTYEGLAMGVPVVTLPPRFLRGRFSLGCYLKMGMTECLAATPEEYATIALRLGTEPDYRRVIAGRIGERSGALFDNFEVAAALADFIGAAHSAP